jgi:hypothetical protein
MPAQIGENGAARPDSSHPQKRPEDIRSFSLLHGKNNSVVFDATALAVPMVAVTAVVTMQPHPVRNTGTRCVTDDSAGDEAYRATDEGARRRAHGGIANALSRARGRRHQRDTRGDDGNCQ